MDKQQDTPHAGHRERMRERFLQNGLEGFHDHEVLEMLLYHAIRRGDTNVLAHELLREFGSLEGVLQADPDALCRVHGVGENTAVFLRFIGAFYGRMEQDRLRGLPLDSLENRCAYFRSRLSGVMDENMLLVCLDGQFKAVRCFTVAKGTPGHVAAEMQTLVRLIMQSHCQRVILAHNHPTGTADPSDKDIFYTQSVQKLLQSIDIELIDHIIVSSAGVCSLRQMGFLTLGR